MRAAWVVTRSDLGAVRQTREMLAEAGVRLWASRAELGKTLPFVSLSLSNCTCLQRRRARAHPHPWWLPGEPVGKSWSMIRFRMQSPVTTLENRLVPSAQVPSLLCSHESTDIFPWPPLSSQVKESFKDLALRGKRDRRTYPDSPKNDLPAEKRSRKAFVDLTNSVRISL